VTLTFDFLTLKVVSQSRVTWAISVPILVFLGLSVLDLGPMYATDRRQTDQKGTTCYNICPYTRLQTLIAYGSIKTPQLVRQISEFHSANNTSKRTEIDTVR